MQRDNENHERKLTQMRDRVKTAEKSIYEQVEKEYEVLVKDKDQQLEEQQEQIGQI